MIGSIFIKSAFIFTLILIIAGSIHSLNTAKEIRDIQKNYELVSKIKDQYIETYNISNLDEISKEEFITFLPNGNYEKALLISRNLKKTDKNYSFIDENVNIDIKKDDRLKVLALKAKIAKEDFISNGESYNITISSSATNSYDLEKDIQNSIKNATNYLYTQILPDIMDVSKDIYDASVVNSIKKFKNEKLESFIPNFKSYKEEDKNQIKEDFLALLKDSLQDYTNGYEARVYKVLQDNL